MEWFIGYLLVGLLLTYVFRSKDKPVIISDFDLAMIILLFWPVVLYVVIPRAKALTWRGKIIWEKRR